MSSKCLSSRPTVSRSFRQLVARQPPRGVECRASGRVQQSIEVANEKIKKDDRVGALREFERAVKEDVSEEERIVLLYNLVAIHASMGDLELAQIPLREALALGLDFDKALTEPLPGMTPWRSSQQVLISLRKFAKTMKTAKAKALLVPGGPTRGMELSPGGIRKAMAMEDVSDLVGAELKDIDPTMGGVVKRVTLLVLSLAGLGLVLFYVGLKFMFPQS